MTGVQTCALPISTVGKESLKKILEDSNINQAFKEVTTSSIYESEIKGFPRDSIKVLDQVKDALDSKIEKFIKHDATNEVRILTKAKNKLLDYLDAESKNYNVAREIYKKGSPEIEALSKGQIGKLSRLSDPQLKTFTQNLFDSKQTDRQVLNNVRDRLYKESPKTWNALVRNEMERKLAQSANLPKTNNYGSTFYDLVLSKDMDMFERALKNNPKELNKLREMQGAFKNLVNSRTVKTAAGQAETSMSRERSSPQWYVNLAKKLTGGQYDKTAIDIIYSPEWDKELANVLSKTGESQSKSFIKLLEKAYQSGTPASTRALSTQREQQ